MCDFADTVLSSVKQSDSETAVSLIRLILNELRLIRYDMKKEVRQLVHDLKPFASMGSNFVPFNTTVDDCKEDISHSNIELKDDFVLCQNENDYNLTDDLNNDLNNIVTIDDQLQDSSETVFDEKISSLHTLSSNQLEIALELANYKNKINPTQLNPLNSSSSVTSGNVVKKLNNSNIGRPTMINNPEYCKNISEIAENNCENKNTDEDKNLSIHTTSIISINKFPWKKRKQPTKHSKLLDNLLHNKTKKCIQQNSLSFDPDNTASSKELIPFPGKQLVKLTKSNQRLSQSPKKKPSCTYCNKQFRSTTDLTRHIRTHTGERPFKCTLCFKRFVRAAHLKKHYQTHQAKERKNLQYYESLTST